MKKEVRYMFGFSVSLTQQPSLSKIQKMQKVGFQLIYTSLVVPSDTLPVAMTHLQQLARFTKQHDLQLVVQITKQTKSLLPKLAKLSIQALIVDESFSKDEVKELALNYRIILNASTLNIDCFQNFKGLNIEAWHDRYEQPFTGLDDTFFQQQNQLIQRENIPLGAFLMSDISTTLNNAPTLEKHRTSSVFAHAIELIQQGIQTIIISDDDLSEEATRQFTDWIHSNYITLYMTSYVLHNPIHQFTFHTRPDLSRDIIRLQESLSYFSENVLFGRSRGRKVGDITMNMLGMGSYAGEVHLVKVDLPENEHIFTIGKIRKEDQPLLSICPCNQKIKLEEMNTPIRKGISFT